MQVLSINKTQSTQCISIYAGNSQGQAGFDANQVANYMPTHAMNSLTLQQHLVAVAILRLQSMILFIKPAARPCYTFNCNTLAL